MQRPLSYGRWQGSSGALLRVNYDNKGFVVCASQIYSYASNPTQLPKMLLQDHFRPFNGPLFGSSAGGGAHPGGSGGVFNEVHQLFSE